MFIRIVRDAGSVEPLLQLPLRVVENDEIRLQSEDPLQVRIEQGAHPRDARHLGREAVEAGDADDLAAVTHGKDHLRHGRDDRHDSLRRRRSTDPPEGADHDQKRHEQTVHRCRVPSPLAG